MYLFMIYLMTLSVAPTHKKGKVLPVIGHEDLEGKYSFFNLGTRWG
jgi:hypothetical protein